MKITTNLDKSMIDTLDKFFAQKTINDVNRETFLVCNLIDKDNKLTISLVFLRDWDSLESNGYNYVVIDNAGAVINFPCYWVCIPKELAIPYIISVLEDVYLTNWNINISSSGDSSGNGNNSSGNNNMSNCPCRC